MQGTYTVPKFQPYRGETDNFCKYDNKLQNIYIKQHSQS